MHDHTKLPPNNNISPNFYRVITTATNSAINNTSPNTTNSSSSNLKISRLGLGTVKLGRNTAVKYPNSFTIPNDKEATALLNLAQELGINLLDTAPAYGNSEQRLGNLLGKSRHNWLISSKAGETFVNGNSYYDFTRAAIINSVHQSLKNLKTDYIDILLIHSNGNDVNIINNFEVFNTLDYLKQQGCIRFFGMSTKTVAGGLLTIQHADAAMVTFNPNNVAELPVIQAAAQQNKIIFVKKAFDSGHLVTNNADNNNNNTADILNFIFKEPGVTSVITGTINTVHLQENAAATIAATLQQ